MADFGDLVDEKPPRKNWKKGGKSRATLNPTFPKAETGGTKELMTAEEWESFCAERREKIYDYENTAPDDGN